MDARSDLPSFRLPRVVPIAQQLPSDPIVDIAASVSQSMKTARVDNVIRPGDRVAIAVGSRGISNLAEIVQSVVSRLTSIGAIPTIAPAMGSHGGATAEGQTKVLQSLGVTESSVGCRVDASMETKVIGKVAGSLDIHFSAAAIDSDHVIVINRIKPHTRITGDLQSGLIKMALIGLGKRSGAEAVHAYFGKNGYVLEPLASPVLEVWQERSPLRFGLAIVEDAVEQTSHVECLRIDQWRSREPELLQMATDRMPGLPFDEVDLLIVDRIGKEISGTGLDTNVVGRKANDLYAAEDEWPKVDEIYIRRLSETTSGNATGIGIATMTHQRVIEQMDHEITRINCETGDHASAGLVHQVVSCDREAFQAFSQRREASNPKQSLSQTKIVAIMDTLSLSTMWCSESMLVSVQENGNVKVLGEPREICWNDAGDWDFLSGSDQA